MPRYIVSIDRTSTYEVEASDEERAVDLALGFEDPDTDESVEETDETTMEHRVRLDGEDFEEKD